ncbi:hypothetical protein [Pseudoxanthomonas mexicana]
MWTFAFGDLRTAPIDFKIPFGHGLLTDPDNSELLRSIKLFIALQTIKTPGAGGTDIDPRAARQRVRYAVVICDYLLRHFRRLSVSKHGFKSMKPDALVELLIAAKTSTLHVNAYEWPQTIFQLSKVDLSSANTRLEPTSADLPPELALRPDELLDADWSVALAVRQTLWEHNLYYREPPINGADQYRLRTRSVLSILYSHTLGGASAQLRIPSLLEACVQRSRKFPTHPPLKSRPSGTRRFVRHISEVLGRFRWLEEYSADAPSAALARLSETKGAIRSTAAQGGRTGTLAIEHTFDCLRLSIEFSLEYGSDLLASYLAYSDHVAGNVSRKGKPATTYPGDDFGERFLVGRARELPITCWSVTPKRIAANPDNVGLLQTLLTLFGFYQIIVGTLTARRASELIGLKTYSVDDMSSSTLSFSAGKSGTQGIRQRMNRPVPFVVKEVLGTLSDFQSKLQSKGRLSRTAGLLSPPRESAHRLHAATKHCYAVCFDFAAAHIQNTTGVDAVRIRQHSLRRFFAMLFIWQNRIGGADTLRWFLGHTDPAHLYHYITEVTPGAVLRGVKAEYIVESALDESLNYPELRALLVDRFGTPDFSLLERGTLVEYVEDLILDGTVEVEPQFIEVPGLPRTEILIRILGKALNAHQ